jgi:hypothetical protein
MSTTVEDVVAVLDEEDISEAHVPRRHPRGKR